MRCGLGMQSSWEQGVAGMVGINDLKTVLEDSPVIEIEGLDYKAWVRGWGVGRERKDRVEGGNVQRDIWNWGLFEERFENVVQWKRPKIYEGDLNEVSK